MLSTWLSGQFVPKVFYLSTGCWRHCLVSLFIIISKHNVCILSGQCVHDYFKTYCFHYCLVSVLIAVPMQEVCVGVARVL